MTTAYTANSAADAFCGIYSAHIHQRPNTLAYMRSVIPIYMYTNNWHRCIPEPLNVSVQLYMAEASVAMTVLQLHVSFRPTLENLATQQASLYVIEGQVLHSPQECARKAHLQAGRVLCVHDDGAGGLVPAAAQVLIHHHLGHHAVHLNRHSHIRLAQQAEHAR